MVAQFCHKGTLAENVLRLWTAAVTRIYCLQPCLRSVQVLQNTLESDLSPA